MRRIAKISMSSFQPDSPSPVTERGPGGEDSKRRASIQAGILRTLLDPPYAIASTSATSST